MDRKSFDYEINKLLDKAENLIPNDELPNLPYMELAPDVHDWYKFEHEIWTIGENIRQLISQNSKKLNSVHVERIIKICLDKKAKRGRQSFVMLLAKRMYTDHAERIVCLLNDNDVDGHVINTLYKMQASNYVHLIEPFLNHNCTWIRNEAKRYVQKFSL